MKTAKPTTSNLNYARDLVKQLKVDQKYRWEQDYWTEEQLYALIQGLEKRVRCG